ncbi:MAG: hypothetical protein AAF542_08460 [Pseudomonadota bacterium]
MPKKFDTKDLDSIYIDGVGLVERGMRLEHPNFGIGVVEEILEFLLSGRKCIGINFESAGYKALAPEHAKLSLPIEKHGILFKVLSWIRLN